MKKNIVICLLFPIALLLVSWGAIGHQTVARIAENHLTPQAQSAVKDLLGNETLPGISSWADQIRSDPRYSETGPYHFVNLPSGLKYEQFSNSIKILKSDNLYHALIKYQHILADSNLSKEKRAEALKFIVHLVGDAHQPMHISRAEDKGGNTIQVRFDDQGTNLHSLWDGKLISRTGQNSEELSKIWDNVTPAQITQWQKDPEIKWVYESYQLSENLYTEIEKGNKLGDDYYKNHITEIQLRITQGGIRLAGLLNQILKNYQPSASTSALSTIPIEAPKTLENTADVSNYVGKAVSLTGVVYDYKIINKNLTLLNIGAHYPNQILTVALRDLQINAADWKDKKIFISGTPQLFKGKIEIEVNDPANIYLKRD